MLHALAWLVARLLYRLRVFGRENLPKTGPVLLVSNHVSYADWLFLMAASPRPVRFLVAENFFDKFFVGWVLRRVRAIPVPRAIHPKSLSAAFGEVTAALKAGDVVCVFPEGFPTRNGAMLPFRRGVESVTESVAAPIIPVYLDQVWGSIFSYKDGRLFWKRSKRGRYPVSVTIGRPLPAGASVHTMRHAVGVLSAEAAKERTRRCVPMHRQFVRIAARHPFRLCLIDPANPSGNLTYGKTLAGAIALSRWLKPLIRDDPMVGIWLPSSNGAALANIAVTMLGKTAVNLNYTASADAVRSAIDQCRIRHVLTAQRFLDRLKLEPGPGVELVRLEEAKAQITNAQRIRAFLSVLLLPGWLLDIWLGLRQHQPSDVATVVFSSGSTGAPKGVVLTQQNITSNIEIFKDYIDYSPRDRVLGILPFFHSFGYTVTLWGALVAGACAVYHADPRAAKEIGELCRQHRCTLMAATATFLRLYLRRCGPDDFKTMRLLVCGAEKLPPSLIEEFRTKFGVEPLEGYGCTELSPVVSVNVPNVTVNRLTQIGTKIGTIGQPLPGIAVRIDDPDTGQPKSIDEDGMLMVTGPNVMRGYLGRDDLTRQKIIDGWYSTGDIARVDADGFITLTGRIERFAKIGGEMVPLELLEDELHKILGVAERMLAVTAIPDAKRGERIVVLHLPLADPSLAELLRRLGERGLPNLWVPDERDCYSVTEFPILGSGKLDLKRLRDLALERAGCGSGP